MANQLVEKRKLNANGDFLREKRLNKLAKAVRIATLPQIIAFITLIILWYSRPYYFAGSWEFFVGAGSLTALPVVSYAIQPLFPKLSGRKLQRVFAVAASVLGYLVCNVVAWVTNASDGLKTFYLTYLLSVTAIALFGLFFRVKCSGHACGLFGPIAFLCVYVSMWYVWGFLLLAPMFWASLKMKRHKLSELILGCAVTGAALIISHIVFNIAF